VLIYSKDSYFISGLHYLTEDLNIRSAEDFIFFDVGSASVMVVSKTLVRRLLALDSLEAFACCRQHVISKYSKLDALGDALIKHTTTIIDVNKLQTLTPAEAYVMKELCAAVSPRRISDSLGVSEKTISGHKVRALKKMGIEKAGAFCVEYFAWLNLWDDYIARPLGHFDSRLQNAPKGRCLSYGRLPEYPFS